MIARLLTTLLAVFFFGASAAFAEPKIIIAEATYIMGDGETPSFAEAMALQKAKQIALEQAGTYLESYTKVQNYQLTAEEIQTIAGGVLQVEVADKKRELIGDGLHLHVKIKATVTTDKVQDLAQRIKGKNVVEEYKKLQEDYARLNKEIEDWKQLVLKTPPGPQREVALDQTREHEKEIVSVQRDEAAFLKRLVSGEALYAEAIDQLKKKQSMIVALTNNLWRQGHIISVGELNMVTNLNDPKNAVVKVPVTVEANEVMQRAIEEVHLYLLLIEAYPELRKLDDGFDKKRIWLELNVTFGNETSASCSVHEDQSRKLWKYDDRLQMIKGKDRLSIGMKMPLEVIKSIKAIEVKFAGDRRRKTCDQVDFY